MLHTARYPALWQGFQHSRMVSLPFLGTLVQNRHHTGICLCSNGPTKPLPQLALHIRQHHCLDVIMKAGIVHFFCLTERVRHGEWQPRNHQQRHHITRKIYPLPAWASSKQHRIGQALEQADDLLPIAPRLQQWKWQAPSQQCMYFTHQAIGCEQHQRMAVNCFYQFFNALRKHLHISPVTGRWHIFWNVQQAILFVVEWRNRFKGSGSNIAFQPQHLPDPCKTAARH